MIEIKKDTKLHEIVLLDPTIITVFYRFGIVLGLSDSTVESICEEKKIDIDFFLAILNTYLSPSYFHSLFISSLESTAQLPFTYSAL